MSSSFLKSWIGNFSKDELKKFIFLALIFAITIGVYWFLRTSKDGVFDTLVGFTWQPIAKWVSLGFIVPLTMFYSYLVDKFPRHRVFYILGSLYGIGALLFAYFLMHPTIGLLNSQSSPWRLLGWAYYLFVESYGSIMVVLFWTFAADTTSPESAKRGFPLLSVFAQCGAFLGSAMNSGRFGHAAVSTKLFFCSAIIISIPLLIFLFMNIIPQDQLKSYDAGSSAGEVKTKKKVGFFEGLKFIVSQPYLLGILFSIMIYEILNTLFDYRFKALIGAEVKQYVLENGIPLEQVGAMKTQMFNQWVGWAGEWMSILAIAAYFLGLGKIGRSIGLTASLLVLPILIGIVALFVGKSTVFVAGVANLIIKAMNYAFYQPIKEQLYVPTSKDAKYKSKAFIEMFGSRCSKATGSLVNMLDMYMPLMFPLISLGSSLALCGVWLMISLYLGRTYEKAVAKNEVVC